MNSSKARYTLLLFSLMLVLSFQSSLSTPLLDVYLPDGISQHQFLLAEFDIMPAEDEQRDHAVIVGWPESIERLNSLGLTYTIVEDNVEEYYRSRLDTELDDMGGYPTFSEISDWMHDFVADNPDITSELDTVGYSLEDNPLVAFKISDNPEIDEDEPEVFINGNIHAREVIVPYVIMNFCELLADNYGIDQRITDIVNEREIWVLPVINPDGYLYNEETHPNGGGMWRKNKRYIDNVLYGVDLNRNFSFMWGFDNQGSSPYVWSETYRGDSPASEPETQVVIDFVNSREFVSCINYHSHGDMIIFPFGYDPDIDSEYLDIYISFAQAMNLTLDWEVGTCPQVLYPVNGDAADWMEGGADNRIFSFVFEVGNSWDGFWPDLDRIEPLSQEQEEPLLTFCEWGGNPLLLGNPPVPVVTAPDTADTNFEISWITDEDPYGNDPMAYDVIEYSGITTSDDAENDNPSWNFNGFEQYNGFSHSGAYSYYSNTGNRYYNYMTTMLEYEVGAGDELVIQCWYDIESNWDYAYVQASFDNGPYFNLAGNITTNWNPNGTNLGNGITGSSGGWVEGVFDLDDHTGENMRLRFAYITDGYVFGDGIYIDDITPVTSFNSAALIAENHIPTELLVNFPLLVEPEDRYYSVRSIDEQDHYSDWSYPAKTHLDAEGGQILSLTATPQNPPVFIDSWGGSFDWNANVENVSEDEVVFDAWTELILPNGNPYGPLNIFENLTLEPGQVLIANPTQFVPAAAPNGMYTYIAKVGDYPTVLAMDTFEFGKLPLDQPMMGHLNVSGWESTEWVFDNSDLSEYSNSSVPEIFKINEVFPNPFNNTTTISISIPQATGLEINVFNLLGREVSSVFSGQVSPGTHKVIFDGKNMNSGVYFVRAMSSDNKIDLAKIVLLK